MRLHAYTLGHVSMAVPATLAMELAEEENEVNMLRCRYARICFGGANTSLLGRIPESRKTVHNPATIRELADIYETTMERAYAHWGIDIKCN